MAEQPAELTHDGIRLAYLDSVPEEAADTAHDLVLVHGWGGHRGFMTPQREFFADRYRVVAVDLRGHGGSRESDAGYGIDRLAEDLIALAEQLQLRSPVVIGHDLGAAVAVEAARRAPDRVGGVVALDGPIAVSEESEYYSRSLSSGLATPHYVEALDNIVGRDMFLPTDDPEIRAWVLGEIRRTPQQVLIDTARARQDWDADAAIAACAVPTHYIASASTPADLRRLTRISPDTSLAMTPEVGHFLQLLAPDRVNALIDAYLVGLTSGPLGPAAADPTLAPVTTDSTVGMPATTPVVPPTPMPSVPPPDGSPTAPSALPPVI